MECRLTVNMPASGEAQVLIAESLLTAGMTLTFLGSPELLEVKIQKACTRGYLLVQRLFLDGKETSFGELCAADGKLEGTQLSISCIYFRGTEGESHVVDIELGRILPQSCGDSEFQLEMQIVPFLCVP